MKNITKIVAAIFALTLVVGVASVASAASYTFTRNLTIGSTGTDVMELQKVLNADPMTQVAASGVGSAGMETTYFGNLTKSAVAKFQAKHNITPPAGYFGPTTRGIVNNMNTVVVGNLPAGCTSTAGYSSITGAKCDGSTTVSVTGNSVNVKLAATSPMAGSVVATQAAADLAEFTLTNTSAVSAVVTNVKLQKTGVAADTTLSNVYLYNGAVRLTDAATVSAGIITFNAGTGLFTIPAGTSVTIAVKADIANVNSQLIGVALVSVTSNVTVSGSFPIAGANMVVYQATAGTIATASLGTLTPSTDTSVQAGTMNYTVLSGTLTITNKDVLLNRATFKVIGSIPSDALQNIKLYVAGTQVASAAGIDSNGFVTFDLTSAPYRIQTGAKLVEVRADVVKGSSRTFTLSIQNAADLGLIDTNYNVGISPTITDSSTNTITVSSGTVSVSQDATLSAGNVVTGSTNVALARYTLRAFGEDMKITSLIVKTSTSTDNVALYANGSQIGSTQTLIGNASTTFNLGSSLVVMAGQTVTLEVRGDLKISGVNQTAGGSVQVSLIGVASNAQGLSSSNLIAVPGAANVPSTVTGPTMSIVNAGLTIAKNSSFNNSTAVSNTNNLKIGSFILQANSSEAARISALTVTLGGTISTTNLANLYVVVSGMTATTPVNPQSSNNITLPTFEIPVSSSKTVDIYADVLNTTGTASTTLGVTGTGVVSGADVSGSTVGQTVTVGAGSLNTPTVLTSISPVPQFVLGNTSGIAIYTLKATSTNGASIINELSFVTAGSASNGITSITVNGVTGTVAQGATTTLTGLNLSVPATFTGVEVPVTVAFNLVGNNGITSNQTAGLKLTSIKYTSGNTVTTAPLTPSVDSQVLTLVAGKPIVTLVTSSRSGLSNTSVKLADITVKADGNPINLTALPYSITSTGVATIVASTSAVVVKVGNTDLTANLLATSSALAVSAGGNGTATITFTGSGYNIPANTTTTFSIYATASTVSGAVNTTSLSSSLGASGSFTWTDVEGNVAGITGALINPYTTTDSSVITN